ncbi:MAG: hypothetical protein KatS3mg079_223 [Caloramator sp.]|nr:MAG: hypothetical protein KatS3mg079_223 [Caloramator sp.]
MSLKVPTEAIVSSRQRRDRARVLCSRIMGLLKIVEIKIGLQSDFEAEVISGLKGRR